MGIIKGVYIGIFLGEWFFRRKRTFVFHGVFADEHFGELVADVVYFIHFGWSGRRKISVFYEF